MLGLFNSGTTLLTESVAANFPRVHAGRGAAGSTRFWKHAPLSAARAAGVLPELGSTVGLGIVRNPFAWLRSMRTQPYDFKFSLRRPDAQTDPRPTAFRKDWLTVPCELNSSKAWSRALMKLNITQSYASIVDVRRS